MELQLDTTKICHSCKKDKKHVELCRMKDTTLRDIVEVEFSVCGVCGKGYCSLRAEPIERECEHCKHAIYSNVKGDGTLLRQLKWSKIKDNNKTIGL